MSRKSTFGVGRRRRKSYLFEGLVVLTVGAFVATTILVGIFIYVNSSIHKNEAAIATLSEELTTLQEQAEEIQSQEMEYKNQIDALQAELSKYEPVVIPDSMKQTQNK